MGTLSTCQFTLPFLERLHKVRDSTTPHVVAISQDDATASAEFNRRFGVTFLTLLDTPEDRYAISRAYGITNVPTLFLIESDGRISDFAEAFDKAMLERVAARFGTEVFRPTDRVPVFLPGRGTKN
jgi:peroxiredoxin